MIHYCGRTDVGRRRTRNEDTILVADNPVSGVDNHPAGLNRNVVLTGVLSSSSIRYHGTSKYRE